MDEKNNQKKKVLILVLVLGLVLLTIGGTYAFYTYTRQGQQENVLTTGRLYFVYDELSEKPSNSINIQNAFPMTTDDGKTQSGQGMFEFEVRATTLGSPIYYGIYLTKKDGSTLEEKVVDTYLTSVGEVDSETPIQNKWTNQEVNIYNKLWISQEPSVIEEGNGKTLEQDKVEENQEDFKKTYRYRMWIDESASEFDENGSWVYGGKTFTVNVNVYASNEELPPPLEPKNESQNTCEELPTPNAPQLAQGMIPVVYKDGNWVVADKDNKDNSWYNYCNQEWANAVTVVEEQRETLTRATENTVIDEQYINTMWVWIPRYEYDYVNIAEYAGGSQETPGEIKVQFLSGTAGESGGNYKLHPAFTFGEEELEGFWYGKFETSPETSCSGKETCNVDTIKPQIKPNVVSWGHIQVAKAFTVSQKMANEFKEEYGFSGIEDTHMSKNSEWGAIAYLSQSTYGKYGNSLYNGANKEVYQNKSTTYITGNSNGTPSQEDSRQEGQYEYDDMTDLKDGKGLAGPGASTTGNITGVYDMSGGADEYVMGVLADDDGQPRSGFLLVANSGFNGTCRSGDCSNVGIDFPNEKYYDLYTSSNPEDESASLACEEGICYGHALSETAGWYNDNQYFVKSSQPWFCRGGIYHNSSTGVFDFGYYIGDANVTNSFHLVLVP